ncbi:restriction endonuclease fold toxin [Streptomyces klenkii]|uniref:restriction endonuclease fold toxin n=1 Tax=Streptomyces klenkii TaxID=1420899 RepID=UPI0034468130
MGGESRVHFENNPREFDVVSDRCVAQSKPAEFQIGSKIRGQAKATFEVVLQSDRIPYFHFEGPPGAGVISKLQEYGRRYGIEPVIDIDPLG